MTRVLITGLSGFIGSHCLRQLLQHDYEIHAVSRSPKADTERVVWHACDLRDPAQAVSIIAAVKPSLLLHGAWIATPGVYASSGENIDWMRSSTAMAIAFGTHGGKRFVGIGTSAEYEPNDAACDEDRTPIRPASVYGKCKAATWSAVQAAAQHFDFSAAWGRLFMPYGPGDAPARLVPSVVRSLMSGSPIRTTDGLQQRDFIYGPDAGGLLVKLLSSEEVGAFNIGSGTPSSVRSAVEYLASRCERPELIEFGALQKPPSDPAVLVADMTKVKRTLKWEATTSLHAGLDQVLADAFASANAIVRQ